MSHLLLWSVVLDTLIAGATLAQDQHDPRKWSIDPRMTGAISSSSRTTAPVTVPEYVNPNVTTRVIHSKFETLVIPPNIRPIPSATITQSDVILETDPVNRNYMFGSAATWPTGPQQVNEASIYTTNGGLTWNGTSTAFPGGGHGGDPGPTIDKNGNVIHSYLRFSGSDYNGVGVVVSTDHGVTWSPERVLTTASSDKNLAGTDDWPASAYYGRSYVVWTNFALPTPPIVVSYTTDGGTTWTAPAPVNTPPSGHLAWGCDVEGGVGGVVYVVWAAPISGGSYTEDFYGFAKSTNGGATWQATENAFDGNGIRGFFTFGFYYVRTNSFPRIAVDKSGGPRNGWIYVVTCDQNLAPGGSDPDIILHRSTDGGTTWTHIRVNQDPMNNGRRQWFPTVCVDPAGGVNVVYYDSRATTTDSSTVYMSRSLDGGNTWTDVEVADHHFQPKPFAPGLENMYQGDYIGVAASNGKVWPFWADDHAGIYQAWTVGIAPIENFGWVKGAITNLNGGAALQNVNVDFIETPNAPGSSDASGAYKAGVQVDTSSTTRNVTMRARAFGFLDTLIAVTVTRNDTITRNFAMTPLDLVVTKDHISFPPIPFPGMTRDSLVVRNQGTSTLTLSSLTTTNPVFVASPGNATILAGDSIVIRVTYTPTIIGSDTGRVVINSNSVYTPRKDVLLEGVSARVAHFTVRPDTFAFSRQAGTDTTTVTFKIFSTGTDSLRYIIDESSILSSRAFRSIKRSVTQQNGDQLGKGDKDKRPAERDSSGGPDAFGYHWIDSDSPGGPLFNWVDITSVGTAITFTDPDDGNTAVPFPFSFSYYGTSFSGSINVCTNGWVSFTSTARTYSNLAIPSSAAPLTGMFAFWDDMNLMNGGTVYYYDDAANNRFIIEYFNVPHYFSGGPYTFEIILRPNGTILYQYLNMDLTLVNSATIGVQDAAGAVALQVVYNATYVHNNLAVLITSDLFSWMSTEPAFGTIAPGDSESVQLRIHPAGLVGRDFYGVQRISGNTPDIGGVRVGLRIITGMADSKDLIPTVFALRQNYPNPFNPTTQIKYDLPVQSTVGLTIYNILGQEVITLERGMMSAGYYTATWSGRNNFGAQVSSGVYFYSIEARPVDGSGTFRSIKKMLMLK